MLFGGEKRFVLNILFGVIEVKTRPLFLFFKRTKIRVYAYGSVFCIYVIFWMTPNILNQQDTYLPFTIIAAAARTGKTAVAWGSHVRSLYCHRVYEQCSCFKYFRDSVHRLHYHVSICCHAAHGSKLGGPHEVHEPRGGQQTVPRNGIWCLEFQVSPTCLSCQTLFFESVSVAENHGIRCW